MILLSSHSPSVKSVAGNEGSRQRTCRGCDSRGAVIQPFDDSLSRGVEDKQVRIN